MYNLLKTHYFWCQILQNKPSVTHTLIIPILYIHLSYMETVVWKNLSIYFTMNGLYWIKYIHWDSRNHCIKLHSQVQQVRFSLSQPTNVCVYINRDKSYFKIYEYSMEKQNRRQSRLLFNYFLMLLPIQPQKIKKLP